MEVIESVLGLRERLRTEHSVALVPTMGNLHEGHYSLVRIARRQAGCVVATIFVNPLQFGAHEDFDRYPRTLAADCEALEAEGADLVFTPPERELYPRPQEVFVDPGPMGSQLEGQFRPGFFRGVCTVVLKLLHLVQPQCAVFGKKDRQQLLIIERMVDQFAVPTRIVAAETARAEDGLALSSRNQYLSGSERAAAPQLFRAIERAAEAIRAGNRAFAELEEEAMGALRAQGWKPDYIAVRQRAGLQSPPQLPPGGPSPDLVVLGAAWLGGTRLIDNVDAGERTR